MFPAIARPPPPPLAPAGFFATGDAKGDWTPPDGIDGGNIVGAAGAAIIGVAATGVAAGTFATGTPTGISATGCSRKLPMSSNSDPNPTPELLRCEVSGTTHFSSHFGQRAFFPMCFSGTRRLAPHLWQLNLIGILTSQTTKWFRRVYQGANARSKNWSFGIVWRGENSTGSVQTATFHHELSYLAECNFVCTSPARFFRRTQNGLR